MAVSGMRGGISIVVVVGDCIATSFIVCGLDRSSAGDRENTRGNLVISRLAGASEIFGVIVFVGIDAVVRSTAGNGVKTLVDTGKKLRQS